MVRCLLWNSGRIPSVRHISAETLDDLDPNDPRAQRSRRDLQRVHRAMGSLTILRNAINNSMGGIQPRTILELGAGDGSLLLRLARALRPQWAGVRLTLLDRHNLVSDQTRAAFAILGWNVSTLCVDVNEWARSASQKYYDLCCTTLFLHHFDDPNLQFLLSHVAAHANTFIACEPRRCELARMGSRLIGCVGANEVTRQDAVKSVAAGFSDSEISAHWPNQDRRWRIAEYAAGAFTHCFVATRDPGKGLT
jgi:SAM-dependent methyltransferase